MDVRGTGRSGGEFRFLDKREQRDLYEVIEWIAQQPWSNGKVGGIGQSYYACSQWFMAIENPPHLACIAPFDGLVDNYRDSPTAAALPAPSSRFLVEQERPHRSISYPVEGPPRMMTWDFPMRGAAASTYDDFWKERAAAENLRQDQGAGILDRRLEQGRSASRRQPARLSARERAEEAPGVRLAEPVRRGRGFFEPAFHEKYMLPFYDWCLKGERTSYLDEPAVRYYRQRHRRVQDVGQLAGARHHLQTVLSEEGAVAAASPRSTTAASTRRRRPRATARPCSTIPTTAGAWAWSASDPTAGPIRRAAC